MKQFMAFWGTQVLLTSVYFLGLYRNTKWKVTDAASLLLLLKTHFSLFQNEVLEFLHSLNRILLLNFNIKLEKLPGLHDCHIESRLFSSFFMFISLLTINLANTLWSFFACFLLLHIFFPISIKMCLYIIFILTFISDLSLMMIPNMWWIFWAKSSTHHFMLLQPCPVLGYLFFSTLL